GRDCMHRLPAGYFKTARKLADAVPCRNRPCCHRPHVVDELANGTLVASAIDTDVCCRSFRLAHEERVCWRLDLAHIMRDIAETLSIAGTVEQLSRDLWKLGTITKRRVPVLL